MKIIAHCCNDIGAWGAGFVLALSKRWRAPRQRYSEAVGILALGRVQFVEVEPDIIVANIIGQHGVGCDETGAPPIRYEALAKGLQTIADLAKSMGCSVHLPRLGCGLAGGEWAAVEFIINVKLCAAGVPVFVYDLPVERGGAS
jgi:O-acetyl-ADP-ribose deacetylase (regulator of RNase III)